MSLHDTASNFPDTKPLCGYPVSPRKFWLLMILTARLYAVYWAYKNFLALDTTPAKRPQILAGINSILIVFRFNHLMKLIEAEGAKHDVPVKFPRIFYLICLFVIIPVIGGVLTYFAVPFALVVPVVLTTWLFSKPNEALLKINAHLAPQALVDTEFTRYNYMLIAVVLAFIFFHPLDNFKLSPTQWLAEQNSVQRCRWIYDDPNDKAEQEEKSRIIKAMDRFWEYYKSQSDKLFESGSDTASNIMLDGRLRSVHPELLWKATKHLDAQGKPQFETTIYSNDPLLSPMIHAMVARAPKFANCKYYCYKQPVPPEKIQDELKTMQRFNLKGFKARCHLQKDNLIAVDITSDQFKDSKDEEVQKAAYALCEYVLGQEAQLSWLGTTTLGGGSGEEPVASAAREFKSDFDMLITASQNKMPNKFYYELTFDEFTKAISSDTSKEANDVKALPKPDFVPNVFLAQERFPFNSCRFSKKGEKIALFASNSNLEDENIVDVFLEELDKEFMRQHAARIIYGEHDVGKLKALMCVKDFDKAKAILRTLGDKYHLSHESWILFFDSELDNEEIRLYPDTKRYEVKEVSGGSK